MSSSDPAARQAAAQRAAFSEQMAMKAALHATARHQPKASRPAAKIFSALLVISIMLVAIGSLVALVLRS